MVVMFYRDNVGGNGATPTLAGVNSSLVLPQPGARPGQRRVKNAMITHLEAAAEAVPSHKESASWHNKTLIMNIRQ